MNINSISPYQYYPVKGDRLYMKGFRTKKRGQLVFADADLVRGEVIIREADKYSKFTIVSSRLKSRGGADRGQGRNKLAPVRRVKCCEEAIDRIKSLDREGLSIRQFLSKKIREDLTASALSGATQNLYSEGISRFTYEKQITMDSECYQILSAIVNDGGIDCPIAHAVSAFILYCL